MTKPISPDTLFRSVNPATGEAFGAYALHDDIAIEHALDRSTRAWRTVREAGIAQRAKWLVALADRLDAEVETLAQLITSEMGKPIAEARGEIRKCAVTCRTTAELGASSARADGGEEPCPRRPRAV